MARGGPADHRDRVVAIRRAQIRQAKRPLRQRLDPPHDGAMTQPAPLASRAGRSPSMRRDLLSAYFATGAKVGSWAVVSAMVFRFLGPGQFALLALIRGTIGLLNYVSLGLAPAIIHEASKATTADVSTLPQNQSGALNYFS